MHGQSCGGPCFFISSLAALAISRTNAGTLSGFVALL